jgi:hypothetical protein
MFWGEEDADLTIVKWNFNQETLGWGMVRGWKNRGFEVTTKPKTNG